ncbi:MAG: glycosyltransferase family 39 protein [Cyanobacteria bacterium J06600_6]
MRKTEKRFLSSEILWIICFLLAGVILYTSGLGNLPLRDWDEGIVAGVARNIWRAEPGSHTWLYPTINYDDPYWNKPPLIHSLIALSYSLFGVSEWSTRLVPALLSACSIPLLYLTAKELFAQRSTAIFSSLVYLTLLPMTRHGRVAMLDGAIACWFCLGLWCLLRGRNHNPWLTGTGIALGAICLTKGMMIGVLLGGILFIFTAWDNPPLLRNPYLWLGACLGMIPAIAWYFLQYLHYGTEFLGISLGDQTFNRIWSPVSTVSAPPWYYLLEIAKYSLPWLIFLPHGLKLAWNKRHLREGKLTLVAGSIYLLAISLMTTKLPWYVIPFYPIFSLLIGMSLDRIWRKQNISYFWQISISFLALVCCLGSVYYGLLAQPSEVKLAQILMTLGISLFLTSILLWQRRRQFISIMAGGFYCALLLLFNSDHWLWELNNDFPVQPIAQMLQGNTPARTNIYTNYPQIRPSLEFYSDRVVLPKSNEELKQLWQQPSPTYFLINSDILPSLDLEDQQVLASSVSWQLITRHSK